MTSEARHAPAEDAPSADVIEVSKETGPDERTDRFGAWIAGRSRRREFWIWLIPLLAVAQGLYMAKVPGVGLVIGLPVLFTMIRRVHDLGWSGWIAFAANVTVNIVALIARTADDTASALISELGHYLCYLVVGILPGQPRANRYGPALGKPRRSKLADTFS